MMRWIIGAMLCLAVGSCALAEPPAATDAPKLTAGSGVDQVLDALDARGKGLKDFSADVSLTEKDPFSGDTTTHVGRVWYQAKGEGDARFHVVFDTKNAGGQTMQDKLEHLVDSGWWIERNYRRKLEVKRQVLKPGEKVNLLKLEGPFPMPVGQSREDVLKQFDVKKIDAAADDPASSVHVQLTPKPDTQYARRFKAIDIWVDTADNFPKRLQTVAERGGTVKITELSKIQVNSGLSDKEFTLDPRPGDDWTVKTEMMDRG